MLKIVEGGIKQDAAQGWGISGGLKGPVDCTANSEKRTMNTVLSLDTKFVRSSSIEFI